MSVTASPKGTVLQDNPLLRAAGPHGDPWAISRLSVSRVPAATTHMCKSLGQDVDVVYELTTLENKSASGCWMEAAVLWFASAW